MTINFIIAIVMLIFIAVLLVSTIMVSLTLIKEIKKLKSETVPSVDEEADEN